MHAAKFIDAITNDYELFTYYFTRAGRLPSNKSYLNDKMFASDFFSRYREQLENSLCLNVENPMFEKSMILCKDSVRKVLFTDVDIKRELDEKEYYLNMLYYE